VQQDTLRAIACFRLLAEKGNVVCQYNLGVLYGQAAAWKDEAESVVWYEKAAMQGYADAQANLALLYIKGEVSFKTTTWPQNTCCKRQHKGTPARSTI
jgi:TPR repeat protein